MTPIDQPFLWIRASAFCYRFTLLTRILLAAAFIPTGMVKLLGERFTLIGPEHPIGAFFEAMYQTGLFWRFIGLSQVVASVLLLIPRVAHLGAALFMPIIVNIFLVTVSLGFGGTIFVTGPMVLAATWLCVWDFHRFRPMFTLDALPGPVPVQRLDRWETLGFVVFAFSLMNVFGITRSFISARFALVFVVVGLVAGVMTLGRFVWVTTRRRAAGRRR